MRQVPGLDALFLHLETPQMPMHVGALHLFELPAGFRGRWVNALRKHLQARLPHAPALRRQLAELPLNLVNPVWVDALPDLRQHVVAHELEAGASLASLQAEVARLHVELLPRDRPLWRFHVFEDIAPGDNGRRRVALYTQLHHAAVDGQAAVALAQVLLDLTPEPRELPAPGAKRRKGSGGLAAMGQVDQWRLALSEQARQFVDLARALPGSAGTLTQVAGSAAGGSLMRTAKTVFARLKGEVAKPNRHGMLNLAPRTRFNVPVSATRSFASLSLPLPALQAARKALGASLNDAVLFLCSSALRALLKDYGELPARKPLIAAVPVSTREAGDASSGNQVTMSSLSLGTHIADPKKRFAHICAASQHMKSGLGALKSLMPTDFPSIGLPWLLGTAARAWGGMAGRIPPLVNLVISNVPGPGVPLYLAGARMLSNAPASIVVHGIALNITVQTYEKHLEIGLIACGEALPDIDALAAQVRAAYDEFIELAAAD